MSQVNGAWTSRLEQATAVAQPGHVRDRLSERLIRVSRKLWHNDGPRASQVHQILRWSGLAILASMVTFILVLVIRHPLATNDGPVHVDFSHLILTLQQSGHPLQQEAYKIQLRPNPNLAVYLLMAALMRVVSAGLAESIVQLLCLVGPIAAGYFALRMIQPKNAWLAVFLLPLVLNQMFFLGLYNHCISTSAFFLAVGTYLWMTRRPSLLRASVLSAAMVLTFFCHASGFIMSTLGIGMMAATTAWCTYRRENRFWKALLEQRYAVVAIVAPLPLAALFLASGDKSITVYGVSFWLRLKYFAVLHLLAVNYPTTDRYFAVAVSSILLVAFGVVTVRVIRDSRGWSAQKREQATGIIVATVASFILMLAFPDYMGGGWTHFRRFEVYPYFFVLLTLAYDMFSVRVLSVFLAVATAAGLALTSSMVQRQAMIQQQIAPLADVSRLVPDHCTLLPLALEIKPRVYDELAWMDYQPYFQSTNRLELTGDRVVLFNYLARLAPYPVHFQPEVEPQAHIFHWKPAQPETAIERIDIDGFEKSSGIAVDYILVWGRVGKKKPPLRSEVQNALAHFKPIYTSQDGVATLYERQDRHSQFCEISRGSSGVASGH